MSNIPQRLIGAWRWLLTHRLFLYTVAVPTTLSILYFGLIASDVYISESRYIVRSSEQQSSSALGLVLKDTGLSRAEDDSYSVENFILSRDALRALDEQLHLKAAFSAPSVDFIRRFASLGRNSGLEEFVLYYQNMVDVQIDSKAQLDVLEQFTRDNPQLPVLRQQAQLLDQQIAAETRNVAGTGGRSLAGKAAEYERVALDKAIADKMLESAMETLTLARNEALRQQLYLERIVQAGVPDKAMEPRRFRNVAATLMLGLIIWGVLSLTVAAVQEQRD